jgi:hypothetical protein
MGYRVKGVLNLEVQFDNPENLFCEKIVEHFRDQKFQDDLYRRNISSIDGWQELIGLEPLYGFYLKSGDYLLIEGIRNHSCNVFILWISNLDISSLLSSFCEEINNKIKRDWKYTRFHKIRRAKLRLNNTEKITIYPSYEGLKTEKIDPENAIKFLDFFSEKAKIPTYKSAYNWTLGIVFIVSIFIFLNNQDTLFLLLGIAIPFIISLVDQLINYKFSRNNKISVRDFRFLTELYKYEENNEEIKDPFTTD